MNRTLRLLHFSCWCLWREIKENVSGKWKLYWYVFSVELTRVQLILNLNIIYMEYLNMRLKNMYVNIKQRKKL